MLRFRFRISKIKRPPRGTSEIPARDIYPPELSTRVTRDTISIRCFPQALCPASLSDSSMRASVLSLRHLHPVHLCPRDIGAVYPILDIPLCSCYRRASGLLLLMCIRYIHRSSLCEILIRDFYHIIRALPHSDIGIRDVHRSSSPKTSTQAGWNNSQGIGRNKNEVTGSFEISLAGLSDYRTD